MPKPKKPWSKTIEEHGIRIRLYERGGRIWRAVIVGRTISATGKPRAVEDRKPLGHGDRKLAEDQAKALAAAIAEAKLTGRPGDSLTLGQLFAAYRQQKFPELSPARVKEAESRMAMFVEAWGREFSIRDLSQTHVDAYCRKRRSLEVVAPGLRERRRGYREPKPIRDGALHGELSWLSTCFNFARGFKVDGRRLLAENPLHDNISWPKEQNPRRPVASHQRFVATLEHVDQVDPAGRLRCILTLARFTGRRESAICALTASDLLISGVRIRTALAASGMDESAADHMPHGAIRWSAENDKQGLLFITPLSEQARAAIDAYLRKNPRVGDVPLFPAPGPKLKKGEEPKGPEKPIARECAAKWLLRAEELAGLPKLVGGVYHPYRRLWATERKGLSDTDVAAAGGWKDTRALKMSYQHADPASVFSVVNMA